NKSSTIFSDKLIFKLFHKIDTGIHPELEMGQFLTGNGGRFAHTPKVVGTVEYRTGHDESRAVGILHEYVPHAPNAWQFAQDTLARFFEQVMALPSEARPVESVFAGQPYVELAEGNAPPMAKDLLGAYLEWSALLGRMMGELHLALASDPDNPAFAP